MPTWKQVANPSGKRAAETIPGGRILFLGAHCDDIEIGCGGTAARCKQEGKTIAFAIATDNGQERKNEARRSAEILGLREENKELFFGFIPDGRLEERQDVLRNWLTQLKENFKPDTIFVHHGSDTHSDHETLYRVTIGVFARQSIFLYPIPKIAPLKTPFHANFYVDTTDFVQQKLKMCNCHTSQAGKAIYLDPVQIKSRAQIAYCEIFGESGGYAEAFYIHVLRPLAGPPPPGLEDLLKCIDAEAVSWFVVIASKPGMQEEVVNALIEAIRLKEDPTERYWIYIALGKIGGKEAEAAVKKGLKDDNKFAALGAEEALKLMGQ